MKVNLIYPIDIEVAGDINRIELPPLGILYVASSLKKEGHKVNVVGIDENTNDLPESDLDGLAITASTTYPKFQRLAREILNTRNTIKIAGNTHSHAFPQSTLSDLGLDAVFIGEAEESLPKFLRYLNSSDNVIEALRNTDSVAYFNENGIYVPNKTIAKVSDVNSLAFPARELMPKENILLENRLRGTDKLITTFVTSRGCPYSCNFCGNLNNGSVRYRSGENIRREVESLSEMYSNFGGLLIMDETFTLSKNHVIETTDSIKGLGIQYVASSRADRMSPDVVSALKESGCMEVKFGVETGSQYLLDRMNKKANIEKFKQGIKTAAEGGLYTKLFLMHGFPGENEETTTETINMLKELQPYVRRIALYRFVPLPGSTVYNRSNEFDLHIGEDPTRFHIYHNNEHWWGSKDDFKIVQEQYQRLESAVVSLFGKVN